MTIRLGDAVVGVSCEDEGTAQLVRERFDGFVDEARIDRAAIHLVVGDRGGPGVRAIPHIRSGGRLLARDRDPEVVLDHLDRILGSMAAELVDPPDSDRQWLPLRILTTDGGSDAVILAVDPPRLLGDRRLHQSGIREIVSWRVNLGGDRITVPGSLTGSVTEQQLDVCSVVMMSSDSSDAASFTALTIRHAYRTWFRTVRRLADNDLVTAVSSSRLRSTIAGHLGLGIGAAGTRSG